MLKLKLLFLGLFMAPIVSAQVGFVVPIPHADPPGKVLRRLKQLTGYGRLALMNKDFADPSYPRVLSDGSIQVYGHGIVEWSSGSARTPWEAFLSAQPPTYKPLRLFHADAKTEIDPTPPWGEEPWDPVIMSWPALNGEEVLYTSVMNPPPDQLHARWPQDNYSRRVYAFRKNRMDRWVREAQPLLSPLVEGSWLGHNYGHQWIFDQKGQAWVFYERVDQNHAQPQNTALFARKMRDPFHVGTENEIRLLPENHAFYPSTKRPDGSSLMEGPRPFRAHLKGKNYYFVSFSSGHYAADIETYGVNILWSEEIEGPYHPILNLAGTDLLDLASEIRTKYGLSWGPGRPSFFQDPQKNWWVLLCAIDAKDKPKNRLVEPSPGQRPYRNYFLAPASLEISAQGNPIIRIFSE